MKPKRIVKAINKIKEIEDRFNISSLKSNHDEYCRNIKNSENPFSKSEYSTYRTYLRYSEIVRQYKDKITAEKISADSFPGKDAPVNDIPILSRSSDTNLTSISSSSNKNMDFYKDNSCRLTEKENVNPTKQQSSSANQSETDQNRPSFNLQNMEKRINRKARPPP